MSELVERLNNSNQEVKNSNDLISRQAAIDALSHMMDIDGFRDGWAVSRANVDCMLKALPSEQSERHLTDDDFETIRIHLSAYKERLCNQCRWKEAEDYQRLIDRFMSFASAQSELLTDKEQRIFLAAMRREEKICEGRDRNHVGEPYEDSLVRVCKEIRRKVKGALWT